MTNSSHDIADEQVALLADSRTPDGAIERHLLSTTSTTFTTTLEAGNLYYLRNESTTDMVFFTIDGTTPDVDADGTAADLGIPVGQGEARAIHFSTGAARTLKAVVSGSGSRVTLYLGGTK